MNKELFLARVADQGFNAPQEKRWAPNLEVEMHTHDQEIILVIIEGQLSLIKEDGVEVYNPGDFCALASGTLHAEKTDSRGATGWIAFKEH